MNTYITQIKSVCLQNKYTKIYCDITNFALLRQSTFSNITSFKKKYGYAEKHHILPRSFRMGGENDPENFVFLTAREHFILHKLLVKMTTANLKYKMLEAISYFSNNKNRKLIFTSRDYEIIKSANSKASSFRNIGNTNYKYRVENDETSKKKSEISKLARWVTDGISQSFTSKHQELVNSGKWRYGRLPASEEFKAKLSIIFNGRKIGPKTEEQKRNYSIARKKMNDEKRKAGNVIHVPANSVIKTCEHCKKTTNSGNYARWHGPKCRKAILTEEN